ncbi:acyl-CoA dehydratase activase [Rhodococcus aetherivorans]|uniref:acyl-CoA dehydratase activase n=1 Tax=Rhodococcus aetherivorans TaxID=191292 RepID=UPI00045C56A7|nr:acyl-CoA dehydratase activase [Rhodococcus aetherivorans]KDE11705.1 benzoyl-CoA reductase [Rhodococcus aetherivorans]MDV6294040.1 acyl-CoA dehydratase activase [Rhodococcus aetherivorans]
MSTDKWFVMGVDLGSTTAKAAVVDQDGALCGTDVVQMGAVSREAVARAIEGASVAAGVPREVIRRTVSTGYGRRLVPGADRTFTEITCHARGAAALRPGVRLVIDIGGQDSKAIIVDDDGLVERFAMNDRCASGTGRFFDVLARALEVDIDAVGDLALAGAHGLEVSSMCATFAETEVISLLAQGQDKADIAASVHRAVAARTLGLVGQVGRATPAVMTGGVAKNPAAIRYVAQALRHPIEVLDQPQIAGAYGAGLLARDEYRGARKVLSARDAATETNMASRSSGGGRHCASCDGVLDGNHAHAGGPVMLELRRNE